MASVCETEIMRVQFPSFNPKKETMIEKTKSFKYRIVKDNFKFTYFIQIRKFGIWFKLKTYNREKLTCYALMPFGLFLLLTIISWGLFSRYGYGVLNKNDYSDCVLILKIYHASLHEKPSRMNIIEEHDYLVKTTSDELIKL